MGIFDLKQTLIFMLGKGGVGRTTSALTLAKLFVERGERVLVVQWAMHDGIGPRYKVPLVGHKETEVEKCLSTMNFDPNEAMREYFVDHLGMKLLHSVVIENKHVQRLIHTAPGIPELFFLGRLFWLVELASAVRGWKYDRIIVDAPATGHGVSLFTVAASVASFGMTGPLAVECERVSQLLADESKVGTVVCTLAEELPVEETLEFIPKITSVLKRPPLFVAINRSISQNLDGDFERVSTEAWFVTLLSAVSDQQAKSAVQLLLNDLIKRNTFEQKLRKACLQLEIPCLLFSDAQLTHPGIDENDVPKVISKEYCLAEAN